MNRNWGIVIIVLVSVFLMTIGYFIGYYEGINDTSNYEDSYQQIAISTCDYSNNITDLVNMQTEVMQSYFDYNFTELEMLNCSLLR